MLPYPCRPGTPPIHQRFPQQWKHYLLQAQIIKMGRTHSLFQASEGINHKAKNTLENNITHRITFSPIIPRNRNPLFASNERLTKKKRVSTDRNSNKIKSKTNNQVAASDAFQISARTTEGLYSNTRGIVETTMERTIHQPMPSFQNPNDTSGDMAETVNSESLSPANEEFPIFLIDGESNPNSDDGAGTSKKRAFERILTYPRTPNTHGEQAISVMAIDVDDLHKKRKILSECALKWTPEEANLSLRSNLTTLPMTTAKLYNMFFRTSPEHIIKFCNRHTIAVICNGTLVTNSRRPRGPSASTHLDEKTIIHGDEPNCPAPADGIGPMSEHDPSVKKAVNPNFNDNISENGFTVVNMSATTSIYSQYSENS
jgi:hypothetical protein